MALTFSSYGSPLFASNIILPIRIMFEAMSSTGTFFVDMCRHRKILREVLDVWMHQ